jgi:hypothetical protein
MEGIRVKFSDDKLFDDCVHGTDGFLTLRDGGDLSVISKDNATEGGRPAVCLTFTVQLPDGRLARAQTVITGRLFAMLGAAFRGRYGDDGDTVCTADIVN